MANAASGHACQHCCCCCLQTYVVMLRSKVPHQVCQSYCWASLLLLGLSHPLFVLHQVQVGHVRLLLPCGESHASSSLEEAVLPGSAAGPGLLERSNSAFASVDTDSGQQAPNMLVVVLAGFEATSRTTEARLSSLASPGRT